MKPTSPQSVVDHKNGDKLDNRRENLRICTIAENIRNSKTSTKKGKTSRYKGVYWVGRIKKWVARIHVDRKGLHVGVFTDEAEAARAYDVAARQHFGEFARTNF
jgi:hypothetical protein